MPGQDERDGMAREIAERRTGMPAYLVDDEAWAAAEAEADAALALSQVHHRRSFFDGSGCGHPPDPVALANVDPPGWHCHCGNGLDPADGREVEGAPGPVVPCDGCGCHVATPSRSEAP